MIAGVDQPFGRDRGGFESQLGLVATRSLGAFGQSYLPRRLHLNALGFHNYDRQSMERRDRYRVGLGYSQPVANDWVVVGDFYRETEREASKARHMAELGTRFQLDPLTVISAGVGAWTGPDSPRFSVLIGFQRSLTFPFSTPR